MSVEIIMIGGNCPVQAEGIIGGKPFYFRARGEHWSMEIGYDSKSSEPAEWYKEEEWGDGPYDAGWMPEEDAINIIERCATEYLNEMSILNENKNES